MLAWMRAEKADILKAIRESGDLSDDTKAQVVAALEQFGKQFA
jgi:F-type H+-transporting ATPase subunit alpha